MSLSAIQISGIIINRFLTTLITSLFEQGSLGFGLLNDIFSSEEQFSRTQNLASLNASE